jgi:predicted HD superfamily hydrolase involved in NAD metabolism
VLWGAWKELFEGNMYEDLKKWLKSRLDEERYMHSLGTEESARDLAQRFGADPDKAALAGLLHDNAKSISKEEMLKIIEENNLPVSEFEKRSPKVLHAPVGAFLAQKELGITDEDVLNSIRYHTTGRINMSNLEKIVYLADKIEPNTREEEYREKIVSVLNKTNDLDEAILLSYDITIRSLLNRKMIITPETINVWNNLILRREKQDKKNI